jgi:hypothetical protein
MKESTPINGRTLPQITEKLNKKYYEFSLSMHRLYSFCEIQNLTLYRRMTYKDVAQLKAQ